ncbi:MAG TPA: T9SS type A sorting domain-containing protein [Bacteroidia bacterium]|nr:T9SS type A sorting domain-containing protein [Bacteroidia bacterium]
MDTIASQQAYTGQFIVKYDPSGMLQWNYHFSYPLHSIIEMLPAHDGAVYIEADIWNTSTSVYDFRLIKINSAGATEWMRDFDFAPQSFASGPNKLVSDDSSNLYMVSNFTTWDSVQVMKFDSSGALKWRRAYSYGSDVDAGRDIVLDHSGHIYVCVQSRLNPYGIATTALRYTTGGVFEWAQTSSAMQYDFPLFIRTYNDSEVAICGICDTTYPFSFYVMKFDSAGNFRWTKTMNISSYLHITVNCTYTPADFLITHTGKFAIAGEIWNNKINMLLDANGNTQWINPAYDSVASISWRVSEDPYGHLVFGGDKFDTLTQQYGGEISVYDTTGNLSWHNIFEYAANIGSAGNRTAIDHAGNIYAAVYDGTTPYATVSVMRFGNIAAVKENEFPGRINIFPNPATDHIYVSTNESVYKNPAFRITDAIGRSIPVKSESRSTDHYYIDVSAFKPGIYFLTVLDAEDSPSTKQFVIVR